MKKQIRNPNVNEALSYAFKERLMNVKRALISVSDKDGVGDFSKELSKLGIEIISTSSTAKTIKNAGVPIKEVSSVTGFPEMLEGRVKTLHPIITGKADKAPAQYYSFDALAPHIEVLLSALARAGQTEEQDQQKAFEVGREIMKVNRELMSLLPKEECSFERVDKALDILRLAAPVIKNIIVRRIIA